MLNKIFTEEEIKALMYEGAITTEEDDDPIFEVVKEDIIDFDREKNSTTIEYVIKECATSRYYKATLNQSQWYLQDEYNCKEEWAEVIPVEITTTVYEEV